MTYNQLFIDCIPGPTYHFGGHSYGNIASMSSALQESNPREMAFEWLKKVETVAATGVTQLIFPSQKRPLYGFKKNKDLKKLSSAYIWMANSGHFTPSCDTFLRKPIFTPANMNLTEHRKYEHHYNRFWTKKMLNIFITPKCIHNDEGAANSIRLSNNDLNTGLNIFVYGNEKSKFPCRQSKESIHEIIHNHQIKNYIILKQSSEAVDTGVFHNDVISFGFKNKLFCHYQAFENQKECLNEINHHYKKLFHHQLDIIEINSITLSEAVDTYLFNSQVIINDNNHYLLCPSSVRENIKTFKIVEQWKLNGHFKDILFIPLSNSLRNGGGPACMRLSIYLSKNEQSLIKKEFILDNEMVNNLREKFIKTYPTNFNPRTFLNSML